MDIVQKQPIPWENRKELGVIKAFWRTVKQVLFKPSEFFSNLELKDWYSSPLYFWLICYFGISIVQTIFEILFGKKGFGEIFITLIISLVFSPVFIFIGAGIVHLGVLIFRGAGGFRGTFNVLAYTSAAYLFSIIPFVGPLIGLIWGIIVAVIGFKKIHNFSTTRAILAYLGILLPVILILLAAIAIPNLLIARRTANEAAAKATVAVISTAMENYAAANNSQYPSDELSLKYAKPSYIDTIYNGKMVQGYVYSVDSNSSGYKITAIPITCNSTGIKNFTMATKARGSVSDCNAK